MFGAKSEKEESNKSQNQKSTNPKSQIRNNEEKSLFIEAFETLVEIIRFNPLRIIILQAYPGLYHGTSG